jgi:DNA-binding winged helix-turn-helix (wHTH) protein/tetratricopeptide (TPR) repeat protein
MKDEGNLFRFGRFLLDANDRMLLCEGRRVPLAPKVLQTLLILVRNRGHVVEKKLLMQEVWPDDAVEEGNLAQHIFTLRKVFGDTTDQPHFIETVPGRGYRFVASVESNQKSAVPERNGLSPKRAPGQQHAELDSAYKHYLKGRFFWNKCSKESLEKSLDCFHQALALEPGYAAAYAGLADSYFRLSTSYWPPREAYPKAMAAVLKALELDETLAEAHAVLGIIKTRCDWDWVAAQKAFERAIEINPDYPTAHQWYGNYLDSLGRFEDALGEKRRALELDPLSLSIHVSIGTSYWMMGKAPDALGKIYDALEMDKNFLPAVLQLGFVNELSGNLSQSIDNLEQALEMDDSPTIQGCLGRAYALAGLRDKAEAIINSLRAQSARRYVSAYVLALITEALGSVDATFAWLEKAYEDHDEFLCWIKVDPRLKSLRHDSRYFDLANRVFALKS